MDQCLGEALDQANGLTRLTRYQCLEQVLNENALDWSPGPMLLFVA